MTDRSYRQRFPTDERECESVRWSCHDVLTNNACCSTTSERVPGERATAVVWRVRRIVKRLLDGPPRSSSGTHAQLTTQKERLAPKPRVRTKARTLLQVNVLLRRSSTFQLGVFDKIITWINLPVTFDHQKKKSSPDTLKCFLHVLSNEACLFQNEIQKERGNI